jgi:hypothetical protein
LGTHIGRREAGFKRRIEARRTHRKAIRSCSFGAGFVNLTRFSTRERDLELDLLFARRIRNRCTACALSNRLRKGKSGREGEANRETHKEKKTAHSYA